MHDGFERTLFHPFVAGEIDPPAAGERALFVNAAPGLRFPERFAGEVTLVQDFRPAFLALEAAGHRVAAAPEGEGFDLGLVLCGRHRGRNELQITEALRRTRPGGLVVVAGGKSEGAASLRRRLETLVPLEGSASKHHGIVFWLRRGEAAMDAARALEEANPPVLVEGRFHTVPGLFSHGQVDAGSRLLAQSLPRDLSGHVADFGAGWGYLAVAVAESCPKVASIDLVEASFAACEAASRNMARLAPGLAARVLWRDATAERAERRYDAIVMNPPFHQGRAAEPSLGEAMIVAARDALKPGGRLVLVANRGLPYEAVLGRCLSGVSELARDGSFKVLSARR